MVIIIYGKEILLEVSERISELSWGLVKFRLLVISGIKCKVVYFF